MKNLDGLRSQIQMHSHIANRDLPKRIASVQFLFFALWFAGQQVEALALFTALILLESVIYVMNRTTPKVTEVSGQRILSHLVLSLSVSCCYYLPGVLLALHPDFGLAVGGIAWILAAMSTNLVMYNALRAFYWTTALPGFPSALIAASAIATKDVNPAAGYTWLLPVSIVCMFIANTIQQLREYRDTHTELERTRADLIESLRRMEHMSLHDGLTGLGNRTSFNALLDKMLSRTTASNPVAVIMIDLNGFKPINDTYGHAAGDAVLVSVAERLGASLRPGAQAFRLGGDEFAVLSYGDDTGGFQRLGDRLAEEIRAPIGFDDKTLLVGASIGIGAADSPETSAADLCTMADQAMYHAKTTRSRTAIIGQPDGQETAPDPYFSTRLVEALKEGQIIPHYQPKLTADGTSIVGFEALARWITEEKEVILPETFLPELDRIGQLPELTLVILEAVLSDLAYWHERGLNPGRISINVPVTSLATHSRRGEVDWLLAQHKGLERHLAFEITEDAYLARAATDVAASLKHFRNLGILIYLDDFGTGHASYQHFKLITPDEIKIDGSIVAEISPGSPAAAIAQGIIHIADGVGAKTVAENVESEAVWYQLKQMGCDFVEGYFFGAAMPREDVAEWLPDHKERVKKRTG